MDEQVAAPLPLNIHRKARLLKLPAFAARQWNSLSDDTVVGVLFEAPPPSQRREKSRNTVNVRTTHPSSSSSPSPKSSSTSESSTKASETVSGGIESAGRHVNTLEPPKAIGTLILSAESIAAFEAAGSVGASAAALKTRALRNIRGLQTRVSKSDHLYLFSHRPVGLTSSLPTAMQGTVVCLPGASTVPEIFCHLDTDRSNGTGPMMIDDEDMGGGNTLERLEGKVNAPMTVTPGGVTLEAVLDETVTAVPGALNADYHSLLRGRRQDELNQFHAVKEEDVVTDVVEEAPRLFRYYRVGGDSEDPRAKRQKKMRESPAERYETAKRIVFDALEKNGNLTMADLSKATKEPPQLLRRVVEEIADCIRDPDAGTRPTYQLKHEFRR